MLQNFAFLRQQVEGQEGKLAWKRKLSISLSFPNKNIQSLLKRTQRELSLYI
jgi:hypothetical protein